MPPERIPDEREVLEALLRLGSVEINFVRLGSVYLVLHRRYLDDKETTTSGTTLALALALALRKISSTSRANSPEAERRATIRGRGTT